MKPILILSILIAAAVSSGADNVWYSNNTAAAAQDGAWWGDSANWNPYVEENLGPTNSDEINALVNIYNDIYIDSDLPEISVNALFFKPSGKTLTIKDGAVLNTASPTNDNAGRDAGFLIESGGTVNLTQSGASVPVKISFAGGVLRGNNVDIAGSANGTDLIFGAEDSDGVFRAAAARSFSVGNKIKIYSPEENPTLFRFNLASSNLLGDNSAGNLKANAFIYSENEIEIAVNFSAVIDFSRIDFSALGGEYCVSFMAMERNYHEDKTVDFSYLDDFNGGAQTAIEYGQEYAYGDNVLFVVSYDSANKIYSMALNVVSVPEPAAYAAIFGALALAFAARRRRK